VCADEVLDYAYVTEIVTYINHVPIESFNFQGETLVKAEDLTHFGFDVKWNGYTKSLTITRNKDKDIDLYNVPAVYLSSKEKIGQPHFMVTTTDVKVFTGNAQYSSYGGVEGYTLINVMDLTCIDNVSASWHPEVNALKIWVEDGLTIYPTMVNSVFKSTPSGTGGYASPYLTAYKRLKEKLLENGGTLSFDDAGIQTRIHYNPEKYGDAILMGFWGLANGVETYAGIYLSENGNPGVLSTIKAPSHRYEGTIVGEFILGKGYFETENTNIIELKDNADSLLHTGFELLDALFKLHSGLSFADVGMHY